MFAKNEFYVVVNCSLGYFVCKYSILVIQIYWLWFWVGGESFDILWYILCSSKLFKAIRILQDFFLELTNWVDLLLKYGKKYNWFRSQKSKYIFAEQNLTTSCETNVLITKISDYYYHVISIYQLSKKDKKKP